MYKCSRRFSHPPFIKWLPPTPCWTRTPHPSSTRTLRHRPWYRAIPTKTLSPSQTTIIITMEMRTPTHSWVLLIWDSISLCIKTLFPIRTRSLVHYESLPSANKTQSPTLTRSLMCAARVLSAHSTCACPMHFLCAWPTYSLCARLHALAQVLQPFRGNLLSYSLCCYCILSIHNNPCASQPFLVSTSESWHCAHNSPTISLCKALCSCATLLLSEYYSKSAIL